MAYFGFWRENLWQSNCNNSIEQITRIINNTDEPSKRQIMNYPDFSLVVFSFLLMIKKKEMHKRLFPCLCDYDWRSKMRLLMGVGQCKGLSSASSSTYTIYSSCSTTTPTHSCSAGYFETDWWRPRKGGSTPSYLCMFRLLFTLLSLYDFLTVYLWLSMVVDKLLNCILLHYTKLEAESFLVPQLVNIYWNCFNCSYTVYNFIKIFFV